MPLSKESTGRSRLPQIRRREVLAAGRILGVRRHYFLNQKDEQFTLDINEALERIWDCSRVRGRLHDLISQQRYDFLLTVLPRPSSHGHHQAATFLALDVVRSLDAGSRPVVLGAEPGQDASAPLFSGIDSQFWANTSTPAAEFTFDRHHAFGFRNALRYDIVVNWVISEHKSQGMFQNDMGRHRYEHFWSFSIGPDDAAALFRRLQGPMLAFKER